MAEDPIGQRKEMRAPWTKIFTAFKVALDIKKLLLAAGGILAMAAGWWLLAVIFYNTRTMPQPVDYGQEGWNDFKRARDRWNLLHELAGTEIKRVEAGDIASSWKEYEDIKKIEEGKFEGKAPERIADLGKIKSYGRLRTWPWFEDRGENPYLLMAGVIKQASSDVRTLPWEPGHFLGWFFSQQLPVLVEPLVKFLSPIAYFFDARAGGLWNRLYLLGVILWTLAVWGFFGGAITRMAAVQVARNEKISMREGLRFAKERFQSFFSAPVFPLIFLGVITFLLILFGLFSGLIPIVGDVFISGLLWPIVIVLGLIMAVVLVGLVGWPLMNPTISAEGSDSFDALSRSYSYVYQAPWHYLWYSVVALAYGAVLVFFVGLMGSLMVYLGQWGVRQTPFISALDREPTYLFIYAPTSFGWRDLLLHSNPEAVPTKVVITPSGVRNESYKMTEQYLARMQWWNYVGAFLVAVWLWLLFLLVVGFGYSFFWTASTIIYLLMRHKVDDTDLDEIHLEEEETEEPFGTDTTAAPVAPPVPTAVPAGNVTMVEAPALRGGPAPASAGAPAPAAAPMTSGEPAPPENKPSGDGATPPPAP